MKKIIYVLTIVILLFSSTSCEDFLTEVSKSSITAENSFITAEDWDAALICSYAMLQKVTGQKLTIVLGEFGTDEVRPFNTSWAAYTELMYYTYTASHSFLYNHYVYSYEGVKSANTVIDMPSNSNMSDEDRTMLIAQARFLRGLFYFELVRMYGRIPLWTTSTVDPDEISKPRCESIDDAYELITGDLEYAAGILPETWSNSNDKGRATSYAAYAFLGRVYLQWGKSAEALEALNNVIGHFNLYDNYADIYSASHKNEEYENIFEVQWSHSGYWGLEGSLQSSYWGARGTGGPTAGGFGWGGFGPTQYLYGQYEDDDKRKTEFFWTEFNGVVQSPPAIKKYYDENYQDQIEDDDLNYVYMRYADVLLMASEALNNIDDSSGKKYEYLNQVRTRAGISSITENDGLSKSEFADVLLKERLLELCCERHRRFDLIRFGKLNEQVQAAYAGYGITVGENQATVYPIPQVAMDANDAMNENNPGY
ncbi:RagB/SusD family nutrient uptake outer membrane protein [Sunxiuqinia indica]|uniref:RagB/SusD family nutrient uptake outer membrane protein n=1 Tax=Sunxiuqinia indica TaxID=2692584 RepID=UPI0013594A87|nr:RagB/SusD family nutrient uptake outer membrane protein [Sunxiuqinia indica]